MSNPTLHSLLLEVAELLAAEKLSAKGKAGMASVAEKLRAMDPSFFASQSEKIKKSWAEKRAAETYKVSVRGPNDWDEIIVGRDILCEKLEFKESYLKVLLAKGRGKFDFTRGESIVTVQRVYTEESPYTPRRPRITLEEKQDKIKRQMGTAVYFPKERLSDRAKKY